MFGAGTLWAVSKLEMKGHPWVSIRFTADLFTSTDYEKNLK